jgi:hypothetical protein
MSTITHDLRKAWRQNPPIAKALLLIAVIIFLLEVVGVVGEIGLAALNLTVIGFLLTMNGTLGEMNTTLDKIAEMLTKES